MRHEHDGRQRLVAILPVVAGRVSDTEIAWIWGTEDGVGQLQRGDRDLRPEAWPFGPAEPLAGHSLGLWPLRCRRDHMDDLEPAGLEFTYQFNDTARGRGLDIVQKNDALTACFQA